MADSVHGLAPDSSGKVSVAFVFADATDVAVFLSLASTLLFWPQESSSPIRQVPSRPRSSLGRRTLVFVTFTI